MFKFFVIFCVLLVSVDASWPCFNLFATSEFITTERITSKHTCCYIDTSCSSGKRKKKRYIAIDDEPYKSDIVKVIKADNMHPTKSKDVDWSCSRSILFSFRLATRDVELESSIPVQRKPGLREGRLKVYWRTTTSTSTYSSTITYTASYCNAMMCLAYGLCS